MKPKLGTLVRLASILFLILQIFPVTQSVTASPSAAPQAAAPQNIMLPANQGSLAPRYHYTRNFGVAEPLIINNPGGLGVDGNGNLYILETAGQRLSKLDATGQLQWSFGTGSPVDNGTDGLNNAEGSIAIDSQGQVYVADTGNKRVVILSEGGAYEGLIGQQSQAQYNFECPSSVAISPNGDIFVLDSCFHNIQIYRSSRYYRSGIGIKGVAGSDNSHFNSPSAIAIVNDNTILVADSNNRRVQECKRDLPTSEEWVCSTFTGANGVQDSSNLYLFGQISTLAYDAVHQRVLVGDQSNNAVKVFDYTNGSLVSILGEMNRPGTDNYHFTTVSALMVDPWGNLYVADTGGTVERVQKYIPALDPIQMLAATHGQVRAIHISGNRLYAVLGMQLGVFDLSNPAVPALMGLSPFSSVAFTDHMAVSGTMVYTIMADQSLAIFNASTPTAPAQVGRLPVQGAQGLAVRGNWAFTVSCCNAITPVLAAIDITDPSNPVLSNFSYPLPELNGAAENDIEQILVDSNYHIFLAAQRAGLVKVTFDTATGAFAGAGVFGDGNMTTAMTFNANATELFIIDRPDLTAVSGHIHRINASTMLSVKQIDTDLVNSISFDSSSSSVFANNWDGFEVYSPYSPTGLDFPIATYATGPNEGLGQIAAAGGRVYAASEGIGLFAYQITIPIQLTGKYTPPAGYGGIIQQNGNLLAVASGDAGWRVLDPADPSDLSVVYQGDTPWTVEQAELFSVADHPYALLMVADGATNRLVLMDMVIPTAPVELANSDAATPGGFNGGGRFLVTNIDPNTQRVFVPGANNGMLVYDINLSSPAFTKIGEANLGLGGTGWSSVLYQSLVIMVKDGLFPQVIDVSNPAAPAKITQLPFASYSLAVWGNHLYLKTVGSGLVHYNLKGSVIPTDWTQSGRFLALSNQPGTVSIKAFGSKVIAYVSDGSRGLRMIDITVPTTAKMVELGYNNYLNGNYSDNQIIGNVVYQTADKAGILSLWAPPYTETTVGGIGTVDSSAIDGVTYAFNNSNRVDSITVLHMPVFNGIAPAMPAGVTNIGHNFQVFVRAPLTDRPIESLTDETYTVTLTYTDSEVGTLNENSLSFYSYNGTGWVKEPTTVLNPDTNTISATPSHFSLWAVGGMDDFTPPNVVSMNIAGTYNTPTPPYSNTAKVPVDLTLPLDTDVEWVRFREEDCPTCVWTDWQWVVLPEPGPGATALTIPFSFNLAPNPDTGLFVDGLKTVTAELRDKANNVTQISDTIILDTRGREDGSLGCSCCRGREGAADRLPCGHFRATQADPGTAGESDWRGNLRAEVSLMPRGGSDEAAATVAHRMDARGREDDSLGCRRH